MGKALHGGAEDAVVGGVEILQQQLYVLRGAEVAELLDEEGLVGDVLGLLYLGVEGRQGLAHGVGLGHHQVDFHAVPEGERLVVVNHLEGFVVGIDHVEEPCLAPEKVVLGVDQTGHEATVHGYAQVAHGLHHADALAGGAFEQRVLQIFAHVEHAQQDHFVAAVDLTHALHMVYNVDAEPKVELALRTDGVVFGQGHALDDFLLAHAPPRIEDLVQRVVVLFVEM